MDDLARIALQEQRLQFECFDTGTAWTLGTRLKQAAESRGAAVAIDIQLHGQPLFYFAMPGTTPDRNGPHRPVAAQATHGVQSK